MSAYAFFLPFKSLIKGERIAIDNEVFRLHYRGTVLLMILFSALLTAKQFFGDPITCHTLGDGAMHGMLTTYCWIHGTYTLKIKGEIMERTYTPKELYTIKLFGRRQQMSGQAHQGFGTHNEDQHEKIYHYYYQWVCLTLFLQALLFYMPRYFWKRVEGGRMSFCTKDQKDPVSNLDERIKRAEKLMDNYRIYKNNSNSYAMKFFFFELVNLLNAVGQLFLIDKIMGQRFIDYGRRIFNYYNEPTVGDKLQVDPMHEVFPKMAKCDFYHHSISGQIDNVDAMCLLPLNVVNEKIFLVMWMWLIFLITASAWAVVYRAVLIMVPSSRTFMLKGEGSKWKDVASACNNGQFGDFFLLRQMSKNVDAKIFGEFLKHLSKEENIFFDENLNRSGTYPTLPKAFWSTLKKRVSAPPLESPGSRDSIETSDSGCKA